MTVSPERDRARVQERGDWRNIRQRLFYCNSQKCSLLSIQYVGVTKPLKWRNCVFFFKRNEKKGENAHAKATASLRLLFQRCRPLDIMKALSSALTRGRIFFSRRHSSGEEVCLIMTSAQQARWPWEDRGQFFSSQIWGQWLTCSCRWGANQTEVRAGARPRSYHTWVHFTIFIVHFTSLENRTSANTWERRLRKDPQWRKASFLSALRQIEELLSQNIPYQENLSYLSQWEDRCRPLIVHPDL